MTLHPTPDHAAATKGTIRVRACKAATGGRGIPASNSKDRDHRSRLYSRWLNQHDDQRILARSVRVAQGDSVPRDVQHRWTHDRRMRAATRLLSTLRLDDLITHRFRLQDAAEAYRLLRDEPQHAIQIIFEYQEELSGAQ